MPLVAGSLLQQTSKQLIIDKLESIWLRTNKFHIYYFSVTISRQAFYSSDFN